eukprot:CAMPEP_0173392980 /NCGR_PEP_ID=MMETSP1356-20130122/21842_1 /TAXON_ID=77927 ORGANISM="Hemiselmis virescens, Strain PCC157" /NCGR_SAMPLE_ID=MMETSP1356 /ASSEMBLY_ACC=CAM_ASM_000847 /LENGTH=416 /DNA_ID=CAMNT_0014350927 /DNA_START=263 /DNA_END=1510 /DNA_ORIENTATION=+
MRNPFHISGRPVDASTSSDSDSSEASSTTSSTRGATRGALHRRGFPSSSSKRGNSSPTCVVDAASTLLHPQHPTSKSLWFSGDWVTAGRDHQAPASRRVSDEGMDGQEPPQATSGASGAVPGWCYCLLYSACACMLQVMNKALLRKWGVPCVFALSFAQTVVAIACLSAASAAGLYRMPAITAQSMLRMLPLSLIALGNQAAGMAGLSVLSLPMYLNLRRLVTPTSLMMEYLVLGRLQHKGIVASVAVLAVGSLIAGASDTDYSPWGYMLTMLANVLTVGHSMYVKHVSDGGRGASVLDMLLFNSLVGLPILLSCSVASGEWARLGDSPSLKDPYTLSLELCVSIAMALLYQISLFACTSRNSPLATSISGNLKDLASSLAGVALEGRMPSVTSSFGLSLSLVGAFSYMYQKALEG